VRTRSHRVDIDSSVAESVRPRPVVLATLDVPLTPSASQLAVDAAVESGAALLVVNLVDQALVPVRLARWDYATLPEVESSLRRPCALAGSLGVAVERLRVRSPRPVTALLELVADRRPGLVVLGADPTLAPRRLYRRTVRALREQPACLVWLPDS
jgi:hypothetical protein